MKTYEEIIKQLDEKIPRSEVSTRDAGNGRSLDYVSGYYVVKRLNEVLLPGNWSYGAEVSLISSGVLQTNRGDTHSTHYMAKVRLVAVVGGKPTEFTDYGYGDGTDKSNPGKSHELAIKESVTDGLKRCAKNLGMSLGLALYSKEQENVEEDGPKSVPPAPTPVAIAVEPRTPPKPVITTKNSPIQPKIPEGSGKEKLLKQISLTSRVLVDSKRKTQEELVALLEGFGVKSKEDLSESQGKKLLTVLEEELNK